ncbi:SDR family NAD(P)-dependent oxidoreductase [Mesorhizobium sp. M0040]|uniref:SDR family NAD(P)-dependent oxidoreductase n=1 Tax=Mesorhizobium sp. M0040 TaxID=2956855 RepID=UPI00333E1758
MPRSDQAMENSRLQLLEGKTAVVTGGAGAIGSAIAVELARAGAQVAVLDLLPKAAEALASRIGHGAVAVGVDLAVESSTRAAAEKVLQHFGSVDILVNNAGILSNHKMADTSIEEWRRVNIVNVEAAFLLAQIFLPGMRSKRWGRVVNISSYAAKSGGLTAGTAYSVSKSAMIGLTFSIARETAGQGVTSNAIAPAYVMSPMVSEQLNDEQRAAQLAQIPVGRFCEPQEVAHTVSFLASPLAGFITGEVIDMNGGLHFD